MMQGVYAYIGIAAFWGERRRAIGGVDGRLADFEYAYARLQVEGALRTISRSGRLTEWGEHLVEGLKDRIGPWLVEPLPLEPVQAAELVGKSHRAGWRIRHARSAPAEVEALASAWTTGDTVRSGAYVSRIVPGSEERWSMSILALVRSRIAPPDGDPVLKPRSHGVAEAEFALVHGDLAVARERFRDRIAADFGDLDAWVGLGLADESCSALLACPELVHALYLRLVNEIPAPSPAELAAWVGRVLTISVV
jgi:hypothetical protein